MNYNEYLVKKSQAMTVEQLAWELFKATGKINYYLLFSALRGKEKELEWSKDNTKSREL